LKDKMRSFFAVVFVAVCFTAIVGECRNNFIRSISPADTFNTIWTYNQSYASKHDLLGPNEWKQDFPVCDTSIPDAKQSPINIVTDDVKIDNAGVLPLTFTGNVCSIDVRNVGATLTASPHDIVNCDVSFTTASGVKYKLHGALFHWHTLYDHRGTEHKVNGQGEAVEVQLVHFNAKFNSIDDAFRDANVGNIAVVAVRYTITPSEENATQVPDLDYIITPTFEKTEFMDLSKDAVADAGKLNLYHLIGNALSLTNLSMFHYNGSLTVPSCDSITSWYIVQRTVMISDAQMDQLRLFKHVTKAQYDDGSLGFEINSNVRPVVPLNDRVVVAWPDIVPTNFSSDSAPPSVLSSSGKFWTTGVIVGISVAGAAVVVVVLILIIVLACRKSDKSGYEGIINVSA